MMERPSNNWWYIINSFLALSVITSLTHSIYPTSRQSNQKTEEENAKCEENRPTHRSSLCLLRRHLHRISIPSHLAWGLWPGWLAIAFRFVENWGCIREKHPFSSHHMLWNKNFQKMRLCSHQKMPVSHHVVCNQKNLHHITFVHTIKNLFTPKMCLRVIHT